MEDHEARNGEKIQKQETKTHTGVERSGSENLPKKADSLQKRGSALAPRRPIYARRIEWSFGLREIAGNRHCQRAADLATIQHIQITFITASLKMSSHQAGLSQVVVGRQ